MSKKIVDIDIQFEDLEDGFFDEANINRRTANIDKNKSKEMREKVSKGNKGKQRTEEGLKNLSNAISYVAKTESWKKNHAAGIKKRSKNPNWRINVGKTKGHKHSEESLKKMRTPRSEEGKANMRGPREKKTCPYCGFIGAGPNMSRYHFDNCKHK